MGPGIFERLGRGVLDLFYPRLACPVCGNFGEGLCPDCQGRLRKADTVEAECGVDERDTGFSLYLHGDVTTKMINRYKLKSSFNALDVMAGSLTESYLEYIRTFDMVSFSPSSEASLKRLRFDHGYLLAKEISKRAGLPLVRLFEPPAKEQKRLDREERRENVRTITFLKQVTVNGHVPLLKGKRILLVDDVLTTGNTVEYCMELIRHEGGVSAYLTFSRI